MQFDLISDLHVEHWPEDKQIQWAGLGTSLIAVIAGDVSRDLTLAYKTIVNISQHYRHVIYLDGNHEHAGRGAINSRRADIAEMFRKYKNITYLFRDSVVLDDTAFIGCNGWYSYDLCEPMMSKQECFHRLVDSGKDQDLLFEQWEMAMEDAEHMSRRISMCTKDPSIKKIVLVTHTIPNNKLAMMPDSNSIHTMGEQGSTFLESVTAHDTNNKTKVWAFGHLHVPMDRMIDGIRYVSNPRGIPAHTMSQPLYYPKCIKC